MEGRIQILSNIGIRDRVKKRIYFYSQNYHYAIITNVDERFEAKEKRRGKVRETTKKRNWNSPYWLKRIYFYIYICSFNISSSRRNKDLGSILVPLPRYEKNIYLNLWHNFFAWKEFRFQRIDLLFEESSNGRKDSERSECLPRRRFHATFLLSFASQSVSQSVNFSTRKMVARRGHRW